MLKWVWWWCRNGIQQRLNSWQDGVSGTNCPIQPGTNWTYVFQTKDQIGSFFYFPSLNFQNAGGGFGPIRVNNRAVILIPFAKPEAEFDLLIGDWYYYGYKKVRSLIKTGDFLFQTVIPNWMLMNGKGPYKNPMSKTYESFTVTKGKTYLFRISNVGSAWSFNFRIQNHRMVLVETEGSYTNQITLDSLDVHVGQSYSVLVTADQEIKDYYIVASPKMFQASDSSSIVGVGVLHYDTSAITPTGPLPFGPDPFDLVFSIIQARSIRWNITTGAARPNPQGTFNVSNVTLSQTFILHGSNATIGGSPHYTVNKVSYLTPDTPLKLADKFSDGVGVYVLDQFPTNTTNAGDAIGTFVASGIHKGWIELVFKNDLLVMDSWHLDGFGFFVVGFGDGEWIPASRWTYNLYDPVVRSTVQVYPGRWTAVYAYLDNPGMWNLRSGSLKNWYLGQELYIRIFDPDNNTAKEEPPPDNLILCGKYKVLPPAPAPSPPTSAISAPAFTPTPWFEMAMICLVLGLNFKF
ncbi:Cupredoxin superfamily protein [Tripterygium wilfordii]|uniref:Cupredoxin superfamily protein n=1 Tax=Tripterygium wilfordii TaxID=458696 RepID=A0A7J7C6A2_TRIWF|nr:Cupredoxin superfamily protein [Tripterygium wilfordii]